VGFLINVSECEDEGGEQLSDCVPFQPNVWAYVDTTVTPSGTTNSATSTTGNATLALPTSGTLNATQAGTWSEGSTYAATFDPPGTQPSGVTYAAVPVPPTVTSISPTQAGAGNPGVTITLAGSLFGTSPTVNVQGIGSNVGSGSDTSTSVTISALNAPAGNYPVTVTVNGVTSNSVNLALVCAVPTDLYTDGFQCLPTGELDFTYVYSSSTGNQADISACWVGENVTYPGNPPSPPFPPNSGFVNPTINPSPQSVIGFLNAYFDHVYPPNGQFPTPYSSGTYTGLQTLGYTCPCQGAPAGTLMATPFSGYSDVPILREVASNGTWWNYVVTKQGVSCSLPLP
jgi:hypothetical protein